MSGWVGRTLLGRAKRGKLARAERHHRTRVLQKTFGVWLALLHVRSGMQVVFAGFLGVTAMHRCDNCCLSAT